MAAFQAALDALKMAATNGKTSKEVQDTVDCVSSSLTLLKLSSPSLNTKKTIAATLRSPFVSLYNALPTQALNLSLALFDNISNDKIAKLELEDDEGRSSWEAVQTSIFSGMLDYVEESGNNESKEAVARAFYPTICSKFFPVSEPSSAAIVGVCLRSTAYMVLYESAENHSGNQRKLRDPNMLGGKRLGNILGETKDFLAVETLFTLFARLLPSINSGNSGRAKRSKFIQEVFLQSSLNCGQELVKVLEEVSKSAWEDTVVLLMNILAKNNIMFPQPFDLDEIRLFFGNIVDDSDSYESLQIRYADVLSIDLASGPSVTRVTVNLSAPAIVAEATMKTSGALTAAFDIKTGDIKRFAEALSSRGLDTCISGQRKRAKMSFTSLSLNMNHGGGPTFSREDQVKDVERAYGLDQSSDTSGPTDIMQETIVFVKPTAAPTSSGLPGWAIMPDAPSPSNANATTGSVPHPFSRTETQVHRDVVFGELDELSNIDGEENLETAGGRSSITIVTSPHLKGGITVSDDDMDKPIVLKTAGGKKASAKMTVIDSETEDDDVAVPKTIDLGRNSLRAGRRTRASAALADRLEAVAAAAAKSSVPRIDDHTTTATTKHIKRSGRAAPVSKTSTNSTGKALPRNASLAAAEVALPVSYDLHPHPIAQSVGEPRITSPSEHSAASCALDGAFSSLYASDYIPQVLPDKFDNAGKSTVHIAPDGRAAGMKRKRNDAPQDSPAPVKATHKRQKGARLDGGEVESRPVKRQRGRPQAEEVNSRPASLEKANTSGMVHAKTPVSTLAAKHYGKKGRSSSPAPSDVLKIDYDALPSAIMRDTPRVSSSVQQRRSPRQAANAVSTATSGTRAWGKETLESSAVTKVKTDTMRTKTRAKRALNMDDVKIPHANAIDRPETKRVTRSTMRKPDSKEPLEEKNKPPKADNNVSVTTKDTTLDPAKIKKAYKAPWEALSFKDSIIEVQVTQTQLTNYEPAQIDKDEHVEDVVMEYTVPTKVDSSADEPVYVSTPQQDAVMIDLTQESPLKINKISHDNPIIVNDDYIPHPLPTQIASIMHPTPNARPRQSVTFAPSVGRRSPSPTTYDRARLFLSPPDHNKTLHSPLKDSPKSDLGRIEMHSQDYYRTSQKKHQGTRNAGGEMQDIVDVLNNIQNEVVRNLSNKFEGVKKDVRVGRDRILREAASDLHEMRGDGVRHFNSLVDLEKDYATHRRQNIQGWEDVKKINLEICQLVSHKIKDHDRGSVSKKLPKLLFSVPIPDSLLKPSLRRK